MSGYSGLPRSQPAVRAPRFCAGVLKGWEAVQKGLPKSYCWSAVFSPFRVVICYWSREFSAFWWAKCLFISSSILISSFDSDFLTSYVFIVSTDSSVSFSDLRMDTSLLWKFISSWMVLIISWEGETMERSLPRGSWACPWGRRGSRRWSPGSGWSLPFHRSDCSASSALRLGFV